MSKRLLTSLFVLVVAISNLSLAQNASAQLSSGSGCPAPLQLIQTNGGAQCWRVYTDVSQLPVGCTNPSDSASIRLGYANSVRSVECQPQSGYSIALPGAINPDGTLKCKFYNPDGSVIMVPIGWNQMPNGTFVWNGGCGAFSSSLDVPLPQPTGGPGVMPNSVDRCDAAQSIANGNPINIVTADGTGTGAVSRIEPATNMSGREACLAVSYQNSCNLTTSTLSIDPKFDLGTCCSRYLVDITGSGDNRCNATGGGSSGGSNTGGTATPWTGTNTGSNPVTSTNTNINSIFAQMTFLTNQINALSQLIANNNGTAGSAGGGFTSGTNTIDPFTSTNAFTQNLINNTFQNQIGTLSGGNAVGTVSAANSSILNGSVSGLVTVTVSHLNVRSTPNTNGSLIRVANLGESISVVSAVIGESVEGVSRWWKMSGGGYIWSGGTTFPAPTAGSSGTTGGNGVIANPNNPGGTITSPVSTKFSVGQRVVVTTNGLNVRTQASASSISMTTKTSGSLGTIVSGGVSLDGGYYWWYVDYDSGPDGWSVENYLAPAGTAGSVGGGSGTTGGNTGTNPQISSTIITTVSSGKTVKVGESWVIAISGGAPNTPVYVVGGRSGAQDKTQFGTTDVNGNYVLSGVFKTADIGSWSETWMVGSNTVKSFSFVVSSAYVNDLFAHSIKFNIGQRVKNVSALDVRATSGTSGTLLGTQPAGAVGTFEGGTYGTYADGYYWWKINYDTGVDGWVIEDYIVDSALDIGPKAPTL